MTIAVAQRPVLVLNRNWQPVNVVNVEKAITMAWSRVKKYVKDEFGRVIEVIETNEPKARIIDVDENFATYTWTDWETVSPKDGEPVITAAKGRFRIPEIILLSKYDSLPNRTVKFSRRQIWKRDNFECQYCGIRPGPQELTIDHVNPRSRGGLTTWINCVLACVECNSTKANRTPEEANMKLRKKPKKPPHSVFKHDYKFRPNSWRKVLDAAYWEVEMVNDNKE